MATSVVVAVALLGACSSSSKSGSSGQKTIGVVAAENFWGNITAQLGGDRVKVKSIITDPGTDPHLYESDASDAAAIADARLVVENGVGYDDFVDKLLSSGPSSTRTIVKAADVLHVTGDTANPHLWYDTTRVPIVAGAIVDALTRIDHAGKATFDANLAKFNLSLTPITGQLTEIKRKYPHAPVAYTERVPEYLLQNAGLDVKTPPGFARAIEDGSEPSAADTAAMDKLMNDNAVKALLYNAQATSPVTNHVRDLARAAGIPIVGVTETIPASAPDYQQWLIGETTALLTALNAQRA